MDARDLNAAMSVFRKPGQKAGLVETESTALCLCCKTRKPVSQMHFVADTGVVKNVLDCICLKCEEENRRAFAQAVRLVCAGCREVVRMDDPSREPTGFEWKAGQCYHVACCPVCAGDRELKSSVVAEKIAFYKERGIPY